MFGLINANARLYSPYLGRFISPDPLLNSEGGVLDYNPYIYARNNPYKYIDRNGEFWWLVAAAIWGGFGNVFANFDNIDNAGGFFSYFGIGAAAGAVGACVGAGVNAALAGGSFWAGFTGTAGGISSTGFFAGAATGAAGGFAGGFMASAGNSWLNGSGFGNGLLNGLQGAIGEAVSDGIFGGILGGIDALIKHTNFFTGIRKFDPKGACFCTECCSLDFEMPEPIFGKYRGTFEGVSVFESKRLGNIFDGAFGVTIPPYGIVVGDGAFTRGFLKGKALVQHEYGHYLQYNLVHFKAYYQIIALESISSIKNHPTTHHKYWTETWANYLSKDYFGDRWLGYFLKGKYPAINISKADWDRIKKAM